MVLVTAVRIGFTAFVLVAMLGVFLWAIGFQSNLIDAQIWERQASPGRLSAAHRLLEQNCAACHTSVKGVQPSKCLECHAENPSLLERQPTRFHASVTSCVECHREHQGVNERPTSMDHEALATIGLRQIRNSHHSSQPTETYERLLSWLKFHEAPPEHPQANPKVSSAEAILDCAACHGSKDRHYGFLGTNCAACHATTNWTIPEFRHPSRDSIDCAECHKAPPSHYMEHFNMISARVARQEHANVSQCYLCHQTTSWNDIKGVGFYKHH